MNRLALMAFCLILSLTTLARADITFDGADRVPAHTIAKVRAKSPDYKSFIYKIFGTDGKRVRTEKGEGGWLLFTGPPGTYRVEAIAGKTDKDGNLTLDEADFTITIGGAPGPLPPPVPPPPIPPPPPPLDEFTRALKEAYAADNEPERGESLLALAAVYTLSAEAVRKHAPATGGDVWNAMSAAAKAAGVVGKLPNTQRVVQAEMAKLGLKLSEKLDAARREQIAVSLARVGKALEACK